jgi:signal peptidase II
MAGDTVRFELAWNRGAFLSLGEHLPDWVRDAVFLGLIPAVLGFVCFAAWRNGFAAHASVVGLALVVGGGLSNWIDRLMNDGIVTDFVSLGVGSLRTGIFNLADVSIMGGVALLFLSLREPKAPEPESP